MSKLLSICLCLLLLGCGANYNEANLVAAKVTRVFSGQTVEVILSPTTQHAKVRIIGIDAPDLRQSPWGERAKEKLSELVLGMPVKIEMEDVEPDRFNRLNAHIWQDNTLVSEKLVKEGCVLANMEYPHSYSKLLIDAQEYARLMGYGIWNPQQALRQTPAQFRSRINHKY